MARNTIQFQKLVYHYLSFTVNMGKNTSVGVYYLSSDIHANFNVHDIEAIDTTSQSAAHLYSAHRAISCVPCVQAH